jgi:uncharacterized protein YndB with AHSA1/START domain
MTVANAETSTSDREIVVKSTIQAPRDLVFELYTKAEHLAHWWGPNGFTVTTHAFDFRRGGVWDFIMHGPDRTDYPTGLSGRRSHLLSASSCSTACGPTNRRPSLLR